MAATGPSSCNSSSVGSTAEKIHLPKYVVGPKPSFASRDAKNHIKFLQDGLGARLLNIFPEDAIEEDHEVVHATLDISGGMFIIFDRSHSAAGTSDVEVPGVGAAAFHIIYETLEEVRAVWEAAVKAGATVAVPLDHYPFLDRTGEEFGALHDPFGIRWTLGNSDPKFYKGRVAEWGVDTT